MDIKELNEFYFQLQMRCNVLMLGLQHRILETEGGGYNGHYYKNSEGIAPGMSMETFRENMRKSQEKELGFSFQFDREVGRDKMYEFVRLLREEGFYY
ncbi:hypothetical protein [Acutalibacter muris]|uniref:hypothetical protein n=1 Tax=Acutalibacter muris TaxID=1796620 RepID=UPI00272A429B|nr:hypothetical protein [Acutalibacter muris]